MLKTLYKIEATIEGSILYDLNRIQLSEKSNMLVSSNGDESVPIIINQTCIPNSEDVTIQMIKQNKLNSLWKELYDITIKHFQPQIGDC